MKLFCGILAVAFLAAAACADGNEPAISDDGLDYLPLQTGAYAVYAVEQITYSQLHQPDTDVFELMTEVVDSFKNNSGTHTYVMHRSTRATTDHAWTPFDTWAIRIEDQQAVVQEGNVPYVKLIFPPDEGLLWDGNIRNNKETDEYRIISIDVPREVNDLTFENTLAVEQEHYDDIVTRKDVRTEVYARGVGLISKEVSQITYCTQQVCLNDQIIETGIIYKQSILAYGQH